MAARFLYVNRLLCARRSSTVHCTRGHLRHLTALPEPAGYSCKPAIDSGASWSPDRDRAARPFDPDQYRSTGRRPNGGRLAPEIKEASMGITTWAGWVTAFAAALAAPSYAQQSA